MGIAFFFFSSSVHPPCCPFSPPDLVGKDDHLNVCTVASRRQCGSSYSEAVGRNAKADCGCILTGCVACAEKKHGLDSRHIGLEHPGMFAAGRPDRPSRFDIVKEIC